MKPALLLLLFLVSATPSLPERKRFAEKLAARHGVVKVPASLEEDCFEYRAPSELGCTATAFLCPRGMASAVCSGSFSEQTGLVLYDHAPLKTDTDPMPELVLTSRAGDDCPECECTDEMGIGFGPGVSPAEMERARKRAEAEAERRHATCVAEAAKKQRRELVTRTCQLLLVDPCRKEAFLRCTGRNGEVEAGDPPLGKTLHFSWAQPADGGVARGGEWQREE
jgi:hypothetical protein